MRGGEKVADVHHQDLPALATFSGHAHITTVGWTQPTRLQTHTHLIDDAIASALRTFRPLMAWGWRAYSPPPPCRGSQTQLTLRLSKPQLADF